jgi:hypothetical protein
MNTRLYARRFPTAADIRRKFAETQSVRITAARCGVPMDIVLNALVAPAD